MRYLHPVVAPGPEPHSAVAGNDGYKGEPHVQYTDGSLLTPLPDMDYLADVEASWKKHTSP